jgi:hypothetical protein
MPSSPDISGIAALSICESRLLAVNDGHVLTEASILGVLADASSSHANTEANDPKHAMHLEVAALIQAIIDSGNSVRRPK